jgi:scyllo-inositol 2-dehydrogenase (NADP+)
MNPPIFMRSKPIKLALLGYGHHTQGEIRRSLQENPDFEVALVYNRGEVRLKEAEKDGFKVTSDLDEVMSDPAIDAVFIGTANKIHLDHCLKAARAGKHILCEKPLSLNSSEVEAMCEAVRQAGVVAHVNHGLPFNPLFSELRNWVNLHCGEIMHFWMRSSRGFGNWKQGARHFAVENPDQSGGWTVHHLCHALDAAMMVIPGRVQTVYHLTQKSSPDCPSEELTQSILVFDSGVTAYLTDGLSLGVTSEVGVIGTDAEIRAVDGKVTLIQSGGPTGEGREGMLKKVVTEKVFPEKLQAKATRVVLRQFAAAIRGEPTHAITFEFVREQYRVLDALKRSAGEQKIISLVD